ncbi:MAG: hypothetical protein AUK03_00790 [Anaerolineae bacterium CG2_30_64_16]|nr:MAG: hypothetical protein AUK03_00790 [Anaerolineae bacterium CG2_30_64_16]
MDMSLLQEITRILTEFAGTKFSAQVLEVQGPVQEGSSYRWRIVSNRYKEVTVLLATKKSLFGKPAPSGIEVYGLGETKALKPNWQDLRDCLAKAELVAVR